MDIIKADKETIDSILSRTRSLLEKHGSRIPGTKGSNIVVNYIIRSDQAAPFRKRIL